MEERGTLGPGTRGRGTQGQDEDYGTARARIAGAKDAGMMGRRGEGRGG